MGSSVPRPHSEPEEPTRLARRLGLGGAVVVGLGAMLGTGVFAAWTPAWLRAGPWLPAALAGAAVVAGLNAWSTARLAAVHPESGGAYAYGIRRLGRPWGVAAGVAFVVGKVASAGAAALAVGAYVWPAAQRPVALVAVAVALGLDLAGVVRTVRATAVAVAVVLTVLAAWVLAALTHDPPAALPGTSAAAPAGTPLGVVAAAGLLFVAFAGYARVATLGEEVRRPRRTLPRAIGVALTVVLLTYVIVGGVMQHWLPALAAAGTPAGDAPVADVASRTGVAGLPALVVVAAALAAGGTLLSLVSGVGRTLFAMAAGGDAPRALATVSRASSVPARAEVAAAAGAAVVAAVGGIGGALALSAAGVLTYYGVAHLAALRLRPDEGRPPRVVPVLGLVGCGGVVVALACVALGMT